METDVQANLVILPKDWAFDFLLFCQRNPKPCPLLDVTEPGDPEPAPLHGFSMEARSGRSSSSGPRTNSRSRSPG